MEKRKRDSSSVGETEEEEEEHCLADKDVKKLKRHDTNLTEETVTSQQSSVCFHGLSPFDERGLNFTVPFSRREEQQTLVAFDELERQMKGEKVLQEEEMECGSTGTLLIPRYPAADIQSPCSSIPTPVQKLSPCLSLSLAGLTDLATINENYRATGLSCVQRIQFDESEKQSVNFNLRKFIQRNYVQLKDDLDPDGVADRLCECDIMSDTERRKIEDANCHGRKSDILLKYLVQYSRKIPEGDKSFISKLLDALEKEKCKYLFEKFKMDESSTKLTDDSDTIHLDNMDNWKENLSYFEKVRGDEVDPKQIIDKLLAKEVLEFDEHENIQDIQFKPDKLKYLIQYIQKKTCREYQNFVQVVREEYPLLSDILTKYDMMDTSTNTENEMIHTVRVRQKSEMLSTSSGYLKDTEIVLSLHGEGREIEQMVVDKGSRIENTKEVEEMMDFSASEVQKYEISSICLTLKHLSNRSQMILFEKWKKSPGQLANIIRNMFTTEHYRQLEEKGINVIDFKIQVRWPDGVISRHDIAENYSFLKEKIEPKNFIDLLKSAIVPANVIESIVLPKGKADRCKEFLLVMVNDENSPIDCFHAKLKELGMIDVINILLDPSKRSSKRMCSCKLTKTAVVKNFSDLVSGITGIDKILQRFAQFPGFDDTIKEAFRSLLVNKNHHTNNVSKKSKDEENKADDQKLKNVEESKVDACLRKILEMPKSEVGVELCLLEEELRGTDQGRIILQNILKKQTSQDDCSLTAKDIRRNWSFLKNELEPRRFLDMLRNIEGIDDDREKILSAAPRQERCTVLLHVLEKNGLAMKKFGPELKRLHLTKIVKFLTDSRVQGSTEYQICRADVKRNAGFLKEEIEPRKFLNMLRRIKDTDDVIEQILSSSPRRMRCSRFYDFLLHASDTVLEEFQFELNELQMPHVISFLINSRPERFQDSTSVKEALVDSYRHIVDEIEPRCLRSIFVERDVYTGHEFDKICSSTSRRARAVSLMQSILKGPVSRTYCFMNALDATGYVSLVSSIRNEMETYKQCPLLYKKTMGIEESFVIEGQFEIGTLQAGMCNISSDTEMQLPSQIVDTDEYVQNWIDTIEEHKGKEVTLTSESATGKTLDENSMPFRCDNEKGDPLNIYSTSNSLEKNGFCCKSNGEDNLGFCHENLSLDSHAFRPQDETGDDSSVFSKSPSAVIEDKAMIRKRGEKDQIVPQNEEKKENKK